MLGARSATGYLLADTLADERAEARRGSNPECSVACATCRPASSTALVCAHPLRGARRAYWDYDVPLLAGDFVTDDAGTGFVHIAPSHGADDYELFVKNGLVDRMTHNVLEDSSFAAHVPFFAGLQVFDAKGKEGKANDAVIDKLVEAGALLARGRLTHSYPHSWRSKAPVIYRNTPQWFVAIDKPLDDGMDDLRRRPSASGR